MTLFQNLFKKRQNGISDHVPLAQREWDKEMTLGEKLDWVCREKKGTYEIVEGRKIRFFHETGAVSVGSGNTLYESLRNLMTELKLEVEL